MIYKHKHPTPSRVQSSISWFFGGWLLGLAAATGGCGSAAAALPQPVAPSSPPKDDGKASQGGEGGVQHAAALEQLLVGPLSWRIDRQGSVRIDLPDADHWTPVKFWGVESLVGYRYGKDHHAIVGGFVVHVDDETAPGACGAAFEHWAQPWIDAFEVAIARDPPRATPWSGKIVDIDSLVARVATLGVRDEYAAAYATYPAWKGACLVLGIAVPGRSELERAKAVCNRFADEILPTVQVMAASEPKERY